MAEVFNEGRLKVLDELYEPGLATRARAWIAPFRDSFSDLKLEIVQLVAEGDAVAARFICSGTRSGVWAPSRPDAPTIPGGTGRARRLVPMSLVAARSIAWQRWVGPDQRASPPDGLITPENCWVDCQRFSTSCRQVGERPHRRGHGAECGYGMHHPASCMHPPGCESIVSLPESIGGWGGPDGCRDLPTSGR